MPTWGAVTYGVVLSGLLAAVALRVVVRERRAAVIATAAAAAAACGLAALLVDIYLY